MAEQANINVGVNIGEGAKSLRTLKQEFKDIQKDLDNVAVGTDAYKKKLQQLLKQKNIGSLVIILLVVIMIYLIVSYFTDVNNISSSVETITESEKQQSVETNDIGKELRDYEAKQEESLKSILKQIEGVGNVEVKINFDGSEVKVPAMDSTVQKSTTEETDGSSGKRVNNQETNGDTIVMTSKENGNEPFILKTDK